MKNKPLLVSAVVFGGLGLIISVLGIVLYMNGNTDILENAAKAFGMTKDRITAATPCQFGIILEIAAFILGYRSLRDETEQ